MHQKKKMIALFLKLIIYKLIIFTMNNIFIDSLTTILYSLYNY